MHIGEDYAVRGIDGSRVRVNLSMTKARRNNSGRFWRAFALGRYAFRNSSNDAQMSRKRFSNHSGKRRKVLRTYRLERFKELEDFVQFITDRRRGVITSTVHIKLIEEGAWCFGVWQFFDRIARLVNCIPNWI